MAGDQTDATAQFQDTSPAPAGNAAVAALIGVLTSSGFYAIVWFVPWSPLQRYFLGHPVAVAATVLFWFAIGVLVAKWLDMVVQRNQLAAISDEDLVPVRNAETPAKRWLEQNDATHVASGWLSELEQLPKATRSSRLVRRLSEILTRQSQRGTSKHLADDLRELSGRDSDAAHDSFGLVRIIVWAIPMLGFLGTVIGITQTLGGLDFSNGTAAVESLKGGLYVAFDTTALGLVLSVIAIFVQFPIERSEQQLLSELDSRVGHLVSANLPSDEASDNQTALVADLCRGVQAAVAESLQNQASLWRETIDAAEQQWNRTHQENNNKIAEALETTLVPALQDHASLIREAAQASGDRFDRHWRKCEEAIHYHSDTLSSQQLDVIAQFEALTDAHQQAGSIIALQRTLESNLDRLADANNAIEQSISASAGDGMADAMRVLARAVDVLSHHLAEAPQLVPRNTGPRRAA